MTFKTCRKINYSIKKRRGNIFKSDLIGCNLYLHNLKNAQLLNVEVQRNANLTSIAVKVTLKIPILWMTGNYLLKNGKFLRIFPVKMSGYFNIDLKHVTIGLVFSMKILNEDMVELDQFEMGTSWAKSSIKYDSSNQHLDRISDFVINKVSTFSEFPCNFILNLS